MSEPGALYRGLGRESESASRNWDKKTEECQGEAGSKQPSLAGAHPLKTDGEVADGGQPPLPASSLVWCVCGVGGLRATSKEERAAGLRQHAGPRNPDGEGTGATGDWDRHPRLPASPLPTSLLALPPVLCPWPPL